MLAQNRKLKPNKKPIANAGKNLTISTASGCATLDATASVDPDGKIVRYVWQKISGPSTGLIENDLTAKPTIVGLKMPGVYTFQVRVIDNRAEWTHANVKVTVVDGDVLN